MALRAIYRSYGGENLKDRPGYYSKLVCLLSFLRACREAGVEPVFLNDGPIPEDRLRLMRDAGEIVDLPGVGLRGSYLAGLRYATDGRWPRTDVVWFSEDDYLYRADALNRLQRAATDVRQAEYFALYGSTVANPAERDEPPARGPRGWRELPPWIVDGHAWVRIRSTASTFGARVGVLADDLGIFRFCMVPHRNMLRDEDTCLLYQGFEPYTYGELLRSAVGRSGGTVKERLRGVYLSPFLFATNLRAHRRPDRRRLLIAADPNFATHLEEARLAPGTDWAAVSEETLAWAVGTGIVEQPTSAA